MSIKRHDVKICLHFYYISNCNKSKKIKLYETTDISCKTLACKNCSLLSFIFSFSLKAKAKPGRRRRESPNQGKHCYSKAQHCETKQKEHYHVCRTRCPVFPSPWQNCLYLSRGHCLYKTDIIRENIPLYLAFKNASISYFHLIEIWKISRPWRKYWKEKLKKA